MNIVAAPNNRSYSCQPVPAFEQTKPMLFRSFVIAVTIAAISACSIEPYSKDSVSQAGKTGRKSLGEPIYKGYACPCTPIYTLTRSVRINGQPDLKAGTQWDARFKSSKNDDLYLQNSDALADGDYGVTLRNGLIVSDAAIYQFRGAHRGRKFSLVDPNDADAFRLDGWTTTFSFWELDYVGPDKAVPSNLRFTIVDKLSGSTHESKGQVEYTHDMATGPEFVVRGVRIRIDKVSADGLVDYTIVSEGND